jgi:hypothetical protein
MQCVRGVSSPALSMGVVEMCKELKLWLQPDEQEPGQREDSYC